MAISRRPSASQAFTLVEVMVAMSVLSLSLASAMVAITLGFRILEDGRMGTLASQVLQSEIETLRLKNWAEIGVLPADEAFAASTTLDAASSHRFHCDRSITTVRADMKRITLTVAWTSIAGQRRSRQYLTYIGKGGLNDYFYRKT